MDFSKEKGFNVYRGLQKPLVFMSLKGKFIYWGMSCVMLAFLSGILLATLVHPVTGIVGGLIFGLGGMFFIHNKQKRGLHTKTKLTGNYIITPQFKRISKY